MRTWLSSSRKSSIYYQIVGVISLGLSSELISQFAKITKDDKDKNRETTVYGTTVEYGGSIYVKIDGSELLTPVQTTAYTKPGERVIVLIKNHTATITGNISSPSARNEDIEGANEISAETKKKITEFEILLAYRITTTDLSAVNAVINTLKAKVAKFTEMSAVSADIETLRSKYANLDFVMADDITALNADIEKLRSKIGTFASISSEDLQAMYADIDNLKAYNADFTYVSADRLSAYNAVIKNLNTTYANIDFSNIGKAAMEYFYSNSGLIKDVTVGDQTITGELVGVTISGDLIKGNTVIANKLVIKGTDGLYYKLNTDGMTTEAEQTDENSLNGSIIKAKSITASKISVTDLVAFGATIGGFNITTAAIYSGVKESIDNTTNGIYMDKDGQFVVGDSNSFIKYYKDSSGSYHLEIMADSIEMRASKASVGGEDEPTPQSYSLDQAKEDIEFLKNEIPTVLRIESSRGTVFKNNSIATVLSVVIYHGSERITDSETMKSVFGDSAYLQWKWQRIDENLFGSILSTDSRIGDNGFTFTISPEDVDSKVTFMCELVA